MADAEQVFKSTHKQALPDQKSAVVEFAVLRPPPARAWGCVCQDLFWARPYRGGWASAAAFLAARAASIFFCIFAGLMYPCDISSQGGALRIQLFFFFFSFFSRFVRACCPPARRKGRLQKGEGGEGTFCSVSCLTHFSLGLQFSCSWPAAGRRAQKARC